MIQIPEAERAREIEARYRMLEQMADFDDRLMEDLINETEPPRDHVMSDLASEVSRMQIVPVFLGSAENGAGVRRLLKALRHETPPLGTAAARLGADGASAAVIRTRHVGQAGRQTVVRVMSGEISDGDQATLADGASHAKQDKAGPGDVVCLGRLDKAARGDLISFDGASRQAGVSPPSRPPSYSLAIETQNRADDVKLAPAMARLVDEDGALVFAPDPVTREFRLGGQGEMHLRVALDRLKRKFGVTVASNPPPSAASTRSSLAVTASSAMCCWTCVPAGAARVWCSIRRSMAVSCHDSISAPWKRARAMPWRAVR